ncbi:MAG: hypothetical protein L0221_13440 [Chloroflexi bacterium]|nr:hypothetical protein [Chloroflexota bacterium]
MSDPPRRSWLEVRWRQLRNPPRPILRAVLSSLVVAVVLGLLYLAYDVALTNGATLPGGDLRLLFLVLDVVVVVTSGAIVTYLVVPQPSGSGSHSLRSGWSAALGFFAAVPVAYLVLVVILQVVRPLVV